MSKQYLTPDELSARYNGQISKRTLSNWRSGSGNGPAFTKVGGKVLYALDAVEAWEDKRTVQNTAQYRR
jgi:hypothetical protein